MFVAWGVTAVLGMCSQIYWWRRPGSSAPQRYDEQRYGKSSANDRRRKRSRERRLQRETKQPLLSADDEESDTDVAARPMRQIARSE
jgi:hypothetical protein